MGDLKMKAYCRSILWQQFGAAMDMLENALNTCPDELWNVRMWNDPGFPPEFSEFWYVAYHCLFWTDLYLSGAVEGFTPPAPFTLVELDPAGVLPDRQYTRVELLAYLEHCRRKCQATIEALTNEQAQRVCKFTWGEISFAGLLLDSMRHVQEHGAQLNMILGQKKGVGSHWVGQDLSEKPLKT
jgi:hypothetical protein